MASSEIPVAARALHRFRVYEMNRPPMGHRCSPEISQLITETIEDDAPPF